MTRILHGNFSDFDELTDAAQRWRLELSKLDHGSFYGELFQLISGDFILSRGRFTSRLRQVGEPAPGLRTVVVPLNPGSNLVWRGRRVTGDNLLVFPRGGDLEAISDAKFDVFTISFAEETLHGVAERMEVPDLERRFGRDEVFRCAPRSMDGLRKILLTVAAGDTALRDDVALLERLVQTELVHLAARAGTDEPVRRRVTRQIQLVREADRLIREHQGEMNTVAALCRWLGVSLRTLQYAFRAQTGVSPKQYINALRLNAVRKHLIRREAAGEPIAAAANAQGFWHMGQFAADYRRLFGVNPSATLNRDA
jgi:AraC family ethanolamine operon transcriptional activator